MKHIFLILTLLCLPFAARCAEEDELWHVLQAKHSLREKDLACARLKSIATSRSVPVLAELLTNEDLSHSARYVLESLPGPEAETALREALTKTSGSNRVGVINSLGIRGDSVAVPDIAGLVFAPNTDIAVAAGVALGKIGSPEALQALLPAWESSHPGPVHSAEVDGVLACANRLLTNGEKADAMKLFLRIYDDETNAAVRMTAYRSLILGSGRSGIAMMIDAIQSSDEAKQGAGLSLAAKLGGSSVTKTLAALLSNVTAPAQIALLEALQQRGDPGATPAVVQVLQSPDGDVRMAAIVALGGTGDGKGAVPLAQIAAAASADEKIAAHQALVDLRRGSVTKAILKSLASAAPDVRVELIRALGDRGDSSAASKLVELASGSDAAVRSASLQALGLVAEPAQLPSMIHLVVDATNDDARSDAGDALSSACQHIQSHTKGSSWKSLADAARTAPVPARVALLKVCSGINDASIRDALRAGASDADKQVREAAIRALCDSQDEALLSDVLKIATGARESTLR